MFSAINTSRSRLLLRICCLLLLIPLAGCNLFGSTPTPVATPDTCTSHSTNPVTLTMSYSSEKTTWMNDVVADFNRRQMTACDGPITVKATPSGSGDSMQQIAAGKIQPDIWSPAGSVWISLLNMLWQNKHGSNLIGTGASDTPSLVSSPVVIAMWKPEAEALGWPQKQIGWADLYNLSKNPQGWAAYGLPQFGAFKFGHTRPDSSNSGLDAAIAENYAGVPNQHGPLTIADVNNPTTQDFVSSVESSIIYYGDNSSANSTGFFATKMFQGGPSYLSAAVMYENLVVEANDHTTYPHLPYPVVAIYPKEGTFNSNHPFAILQGNWMTPAKKAAALVFRNFLLAPAQQAKALRYGFRPGDINIPLAAPIDAAHGVDPQQPASVLQVPSATVVQAVEQSWENLRRKVDVMLVLDRSGSMADQVGGIRKIDAAKQGMGDFVNLLGNHDGLGVTTFSDTSQVLRPVNLLGQQRPQILSLINGIQVGGNTRLYDTIDQQWHALKDSVANQHIKVVLVLTDGMDNASHLSLNQLISDISPHGADVGNSIKVFTIAYGSDANGTILTQIANATGGQEYSGTPANIRQVYMQISQFF